MELHSIDRGGRVFIVTPICSSVKDGLPLECLIPIGLGPISLSLDMVREYREWKNEELMPHGPFDSQNEGFVCSILEKRTLCESHSTPFRLPWGVVLPVPRHTLCPP